MKLEIKILYRAILKEHCLIAPHETGDETIVQLWDPIGQKKRYRFKITQKDGIELIEPYGARWDEGHPSGSFSLINRLPGIY